MMDQNPLRCLGAIVSGQPGEGFSKNSLALVDLHRTMAEPARYDYGYGYDGPPGNALWTPEYMSGSNLSILVIFDEV